MPKLIATHEVDDVAHWLASPKRAEVFGSAATDIRTFVDPQTPDRSGSAWTFPTWTPSRRSWRATRVQQP